MLFYKSRNFTVRQFAYSGFSLLMILSCALASCGGAAPTQAPVVPEIAQSCDPANPLLAAINNIQKLDKSEYGDGFVSYQGSYINDKTGQKFQITASSLPDADYAQVFLKSLQVCFEALEIPNSAGQFDNSKLDTDVDLNAERQARADILKAQPNSVDILMEWLSNDDELKSENVWVIHFYIDPTIDSDDGVDGYRAKCGYKASVQPDLTGRSLVSSSAYVTATLYRAGSLVPAPYSTTANSAHRLPTAVSNNNGKKLTTYDTKVAGTRSQAYNIYGSWTENNSGITSNACT